MAALPQDGRPRTSNQPLVLIALALATGILVFHYYHNSKLAIALIVAALMCFVFAIRIRQRVATIATAALVLSFICTGYVLALVQGQNVSSDRIVAMFDRGEIMF